MVRPGRRFSFQLDLGHARIALVVVAVVQAFWFGWALHRTEPVSWGDTHDYQYVADELARGHFGVISNFFRPAGYPALLLASQVLGVKPTVAAVVFNRAAAIAAVVALPGAAAVGVGAGYLLLCSYSTIVSYENFLMSESPMPGFLLLAWVMGLLAYRAVVARRYEVATSWLIVQYVWLCSLKPAFKAYCILELVILALFCALSTPRLKRSDSRRVGLNMIGMLAVTLFVNGVVFRNSGSEPMILNKAITLVHALPFLTPSEVAALPPEVQKTYGVYRKLWVRTPENYNGIPVPAPDGAKLFDYLVVRHFSVFARLYARKMVQLVRFSSWNENFGSIDMTVGIPRGFGSAGILVTTLLFGALLALGLGTRVRPDLIVLAETGGAAVYGFAVQMFIAANDAARISMIWVIPGFVFLVQFWWWAGVRVLGGATGQRGSQRGNGA